MNIVILGAGGHGRVVAECLRACGRAIEGFTDRAPALAGKTAGGLPVLGDDSILERRKPDEIRLVNGVGVAGSLAPRTALYADWTAKGFHFETVVAPSATVAPSAVLGEGAQVLTRAVVHPGAAIGANAVLNTACVVEHDCVVGVHAFIGPGAILGGGARVGAGALIGLGAVVLPGVVVGDAAIVGAGAVVLSEVRASETVAGNPARRIP